MHDDDDDDDDNDRYECTFLCKRQPDRQDIQASQKRVLLA